MTNRQALREELLPVLDLHFWSLDVPEEENRLKILAAAQNLEALIDAYTKQSVEQHFQAIVPDEGPLEDTKGTYADGYAQAVKDVCNAHYATLKGDNHE